MSEKVDARGRSCPEPVIMTKEAIETYDGKQIQILLDAMVAVENVEKYAKNQGYSVEQVSHGDDFSLIISK